MCALITVLFAAPLRAQWSEPGMRTCPAADSAIGKMRKMNKPRVRFLYIPERDASLIVTHLRATSWQVGRSRVVGIEGRIPVAGRGPDSNPSFEFALMVLDSVERVPSEMPRVMVLDKRDTLRAYDPQVRPVLNQPKVKGVPLTIRYGLTVEETRRLAKAKEATGMLGPHRFMLYDWELHDLEAVYRVARCGGADW